MKNYQKKAIRTVGFQAILLVSLVIIQIAVQFAQSYKWVGFVKKDQSTWIGIAEVAQADKLDLQNQLDQCIKDKHTAEAAANPDLFGGNNE